MLYKKNKKAYNSFIIYLIKEGKKTENKDKKNITRKRIINYVLKEFGLKVSNLYISQIKRKCGIEVGENYNLPKTENPKVPQCPKEKEDAIKAALKYFAMI